jgi:3-phosphoshikimate 1-carboxyvinyltransferase
MLADRGVVVAADPDAATPAWRVSPGRIAPRDEAIEPDLVNAAVFLAAAAATGGSVTVPWPRHTLQAADRILGVLTELGAEFRLADDEVTVTGGVLRGADVDLTEAAELTCVVAALLALSGEPGRIRGVAHVRLHETDRLAALERELGRRGARVRQTDDGLAFEGGRLVGGGFGTYADHRMAHAGAVLGLRVPEVVLDDVMCTTKTLADFPGLWHGLVDA